MQLVAEQAQAMAIPPQDLDQIAALAAKDEDMATEGINVERRLHDGSQAIEATSHVGDTGDQPDTSAGRQADHLGTPKPDCSSSRNTMPRTAWFGVPRMMTAASPRRTSISPSSTAAVNCARADDGAGWL